MLQFQTLHYQYLVFSYSLLIFIMVSHFGLFITHKKDTYKHGPVFNAVKGRMQSQIENSTQAVLVDTSR